MNEEFIYAMVLNRYIELMNSEKNISNSIPVIDEMDKGKDFIPAGFESGFSIKTKIDILIEAIDKNIPIKNTELYNSSIEGVRQI